MTPNQQAAVEKATREPGARTESIPTLATAVKDAKATREQMFTLRHFHLGDPGAGARLEGVGDDWLPALLDAYRDTIRLRYNYPLLLFPPDPGHDQQNAEALAGPLPEWLQETLNSVAPGEDSARILKDSLPWLERYLRHGRAEQEAPEDAFALLAEAGQALQRHLRLDEANRKRLAGDLERLQTSIPEGCRILTYGRYAALHLLIHAVGSRVLPRRERFQEQVNSCIRGLKALLTIEWGKSEQSIEPQAARASVGPSGDLFDSQVLSAVMDHSRGTREMARQRRQRIEKALAVLESWQAAPVLVRIVYQQRPSGDWLERNPTLAAVNDDEPCVRATREFDRQAAQLAEVFSAVRVAQLEIGGRYDPSIHDPWFANFNWEAFSHDELLLVPLVVALESADRVADTGLRAFSRLLSSGRPVQILVRVQPHNNPGAGADENPFASYRTELGYLGLSHRQAVVTQSSPARHQHLLSCFLSALDATRTSLHIINVGLRPAGKLLPLNAWLVAGAGIESRAHPFFRINPEAGDSAASRMDFSGNPQPGVLWPTHPFNYQDDNGNAVSTELAFTFADYALLIERLRDHFRLVPPVCDSDALTPMQEYLAMTPDEAYQRVPFVWAVDGSAQLHRLVVSRAVTLACRDRQNFWRSLQELAGVRNRYVERAVTDTRAEERARAAEARTRLMAEHDRELEQVRRTAAGEAMQRLTDTLLGIDFSAATPLGFTPAPASTPVAESKPETTDSDAVAQPEAAAGEEEAFDEPWIDTPLCTSCNDCTKLNPRLFVYNEDKQALLGDIKAGSFSELVQAAELCPANCIHPGTPLDTDEPGLDELIARAASYNQL